VMYIHHVILNTGSIARINRVDVSDDVVSVMRSWLEEALAHTGDFPLPDVLGMGDVHHAQVTVQNGALVCTVFGSLLVPLVTFGVAVRSRHAHLWTTMVEQFGARDGIKVPDTPWCAVVQHPAYLAHQGASSWMDEFVQSVAWARIKRG